MDARSSESRHRALFVLVVSAAVGAALIELSRRYQPEFAAWVRADPEPRSRLVLAGLALAVAGPLLAAGGAIWVRADPGSPRGPLLRVVAVLMALSGCIAAWMLWRLAALLTSAP